MTQIKVRRSCPQCDGEPKPQPDCELCGGTGWEESWIDLGRFVRGIRENEPIEAVVSLEIQIEKWDH